MRGECRLVGLGVVGVVMGFRVNRILVARIGTVCVVCVMMAVGVIDMFDRVLFSRQIVSLDTRSTSRSYLVILTVGWSAKRSLDGMGRCG